MHSALWFTWQTSLGLCNCTLLSVSSLESHSTGPVWALFLLDSVSASLLPQFDYFCLFALSVNFQVLKRGHRIDFVLDWDRYLLPGSTDSWWNANLSNSRTCRHHLYSNVFAWAACPCRLTQSWGRIVTSSIATLKLLSFQIRLQSP